MAECIFCAIAHGTLESSVVLDDDEVLAFLDIHPFATGHTVIIPRRHVQRLGELTDRERAALMHAGSRVGDLLRQAGLADDVHLVLNDGEAAAQTVPHAHLHVVPRRGGDKRRMIPRVLTAFAPPLWRRRRAALDETAARLRALLS